MKPANGNHEVGPGSVNDVESRGALWLGSDPNHAARFGSDEIRRYTSELEIPFDPRVLEWRVTNTSRDKSRGQVIPYADQRAYTDRLNALFTPSGWTRKYTIHTSANFERSRDQKTVAKVLVTCELTILGLGSHSATGEEWADNDNAGTAAEAQAFKRACCCFGLGRYLYYFRGDWVDLDERKRPKNIPTLPLWAKPEGWRSGTRPTDERVESGKKRTGIEVSPAQDDPTFCEERNLMSQIEAMAEPLGKGLYRGLLKAIARAWTPKQIHELETLRKVLAHMQAAGRGLRRLEIALNHKGPEALSRVLRSMELLSVDQVNSLETLKRVVLALEASDEVDDFSRN